MAVLLALLNFHDDSSKFREPLAQRHSAKSPEGLNIQPDYRENVNPRIGQRIFSLFFRLCLIQKLISVFEC